MNRNKIVDAIDAVAGDVLAGVDTDAFVCHLLSKHIDKPEDSPEALAFDDVFRPTYAERTALQGWSCFKNNPSYIDHRTARFSAWGCDNINTQAANEHRLTMLLFFLEMLDSGDL